MAKTTGYKIREAIKLHEMRKSVLQGQFGNSLVQFEDEEKGDPRELAQQIRQEETAIAKLQVAQTSYNLQVKLEVGGQQITLCEAVKSIGGAGRMEQLWNTVANSRDDYGRSYGGERSRDPNQERAKNQVTPQEALGEATKSAKQAAQLRAGIAEGNSEQVEIPSLDASLLQ